MSALDGIAPEFRTDAGMVIRLSALILVMEVTVKWIGWPRTPK